VITFCVKLKKTATETFEMLKSVHNEECLSRTSVFEWHKTFKEAQKMRMKKSWVKTMLTAFFDTKGIIQHEFVLEKHTVNSKFYKEVIKRLIAQVRCIRPQFWETGSWYILQDNSLAHSSGVVSEFLAKRGAPVLYHPPCSPDLVLDDFFYFLH
jgi:hypothetical protein